MGQAGTGAAPAAATPRRCPPLRANEGEVAPSGAQWRAMAGNAARRRPHQAPPAVMADLAAMDDMDDMDDMVASRGKTVIHVIHGRSRARTSPRPCPFAPLLLSSQAAPLCCHPKPLPSVVMPSRPLPVTPTPLPVIPSGERGISFPSWTSGFLACGLGMTGMLGPGFLASGPE